MNNSLANMGYRELGMAGALLTAYSDGSQNFASDTDYTNFEHDGINVEFNPNSGYVYLINSEFQVLMLNDDEKLEMYLTCAECGREDFRSQEAWINDSLCSNCHLENDNA